MKLCMQIEVFCINISRLKSDYQVYHITGIWYLVLFITRNKI